jgi:D-glycero-D-manno-heptose 1,7-bisphosphate phosphatase
MKKNNAVFFDRDGIVNRRKIDEYVTQWDDFIFEESIFSILQKVTQAGFLAILITNQQGIGKRLMTEQDLADIHANMQAELQSRSGVQFDAIYFCGELNSSPTSRRKPSPAMLLEAIEAYSIDAQHSWMIGDSISDATAGKRAGVQTILIGAEYTQGSVADADYVFADLMEFERSVLLQEITSKVV